MKLSFDHTTDYSLREFNKFIKKADFVPDYVQDSEVQTKETVGGLGKEAFADPYNHAYPKNNRANTYLSYIHFLNKKAALEEHYNDAYVNLVETNLKQAAELFGIQNDIKNYTDQYNAKEAVAYEEKSVFETKVGDQEIALFNYKTAEELKQAAEQFAKEYNKIPFEWRSEICHNFVKHASDMDLDEIPDIIAKYAGMFYCDPNHVKTELERRAFRNPVKEAKEIYHKLSEAVDDFDSMEEYMKTASIVYNLEKQAGLYEKKASRRIFNDPYDALFTLSLEKVADMLNVVEVDGNYYKVADILEVEPHVFQEAFGIDKLSSADEVRDVFPTMPRSDFNLFRELSNLKAV